MIINQNTPLCFILVLLFVLFVNYTKIDFFFKFNVILTEQGQRFTNITCFFLEWTRFQLVYAILSFTINMNWHVTIYL